MKQTALPSWGVTPVLLLVAICYACRPAGASILYVNKSAAGSVHDGATWDTAFTSVQTAISAAAPGDELWVAAGTYVESITLKGSVPIYGGFVGVESARGQRNWKSNATILDGNRSTTVDVVTSAAHDTTLDGLVVRNGRRGISVTNGPIVLVNCVFSTNYDGIYIAGGSVKVTGCTVRANSYYGAYVCGGTAIVNACTISRNGATGIAGGFPGSVDVTNCTISANSVGVDSAKTITSCTISGNAYGAYVGYTGTTTVANCIVSFNGRGICQHAGDLTVTLEHNDVYGNVFGNFLGIGDRTGFDGNISQDPMLSNAFHDIHIQPASPCIDAGDDSSVQTSGLDIDGQPRIMGAHTDIGSDESDATTWVVPSRIYYVSTTGDDRNDGTSWLLSKRSVGAGLAVAEGRDEVWVAKGIYNEIIDLPPGVALYGGFIGTETTRNQRDWKVNAAELVGAGNQVITSNSLDILVDGLVVRNGAYGIDMGDGTATIVNCTITGNNSVAISVTGGAATVTDCNITANSSEGIYVDGGTATITGCRIDENWYGISVFGAASIARCTLNGNLFGVFCDSAKEPTITNCIVSGSNWNGLMVVGGTATIENCTSVGNGAGVYVTGGTAIVTNCIVSANGTGIRGYDSVNGLVLSHDDVFDNRGVNYEGYADSTGSRGNISADPLFVNTASGDFHLLSGSPCIDAGDDTVLTHGETDMDGNPRKLGAHVDMGAYEFLVPGFYSMADAAKALRMAAGIDAGAGNIARWNVSASTTGVDLVDAVRIARKVAGLEANPQG